jgi:NHL repeat
MTHPTTHTARTRSALAIETGWLPLPTKPALPGRLSLPGKLRRARRKTRNAILLPLAIIIIVLILEAGVAHAEITQIGEIGNKEPNAIIEEGGVAVNQSTGNIYETDISGDRVIEYTPSGELVLMFGKNVNKTKTGTPAANICTQNEITNEHVECEPGEPGSEPGQFNIPSGIAVSPVNEDIYIGDTGNNRVQIFDPTGHYTNQINPGTTNNTTFTLEAFDPNVAGTSTGNILILDRAGERVLEYTPAGQPTGTIYGPATFGKETLYDVESLATDEKDDVYVGGVENVVEFSPEAQAIKTYPGTNSGKVGIDPHTSNIFVANPHGDGKILEIPGEDLLSEFGSIERVRGVGYDVAEGKLYISEFGLRRVAVYGTFPTPPKGPPLVEVAPLLGLTQVTATLAARVTPNGLSSAFYFLYGTDDMLLGAQRAPAVPVGIGSGYARSIANEMVSVQPNTRYYYRVVAENAFGGGSKVEGPVQSFTTPAPAPSAVTGGATEVGSSTVLLNGLVDPGSMGVSSDTRWCFQYGMTTGYEGVSPGSAGDAGEGAGSVSVDTQLAGLRRDTVYHYRLVAVNSLGLGLGSSVCNTPGGVESVGMDETFTTGTPSPPVVETGGASAITATSGTLSATVDPGGIPTTYEFDLGTDTTYGARVFGEETSSMVPLGVTVSVGGLQPGRTYHYRVVASSAYGTSYGLDESFTTPAVPGSGLVAPVTSPLIATPVLSFPSEPRAPKKNGGGKKKHVKKKKVKKKKKRNGKGGKRGAGKAGRVNVKSGVLGSVGSAGGGQA